MPPLCLLQSIGFNILRQHAFRGIERHDNTQSALADLFHAEAPLRTGQCQNGQRNRKRADKIFHPLAAGRVTRHHDAPKFRVGQSGKAAGTGPNQQGGRNHQRDQRREP